MPLYLLCVDDKLGLIYFFLHARVCAYVCAPSNSDVDFLLSQVSHNGENWKKTYREIL